MRALVTSLLALAVAVLVSGTAVAATPNTKQMVLKLQDLPAGFSLDKGYHTNNARAAKESKIQTLADYGARAP